MKVIIFFLIPTKRFLFEERKGFSHKMIRTLLVIVLREPCQETESFIEKFQKINTRLKYNGNSQSENDSETVAAVNDTKLPQSWKA